MGGFFDDERFSVIPQTMVDGLIVIDGAGAIRHFNHACERLFLYSAEEALGQNVSILMPGELAAIHDSFIQRHRETRVQRIIGIGRELTGKRKDGSLFPMYLSVGEGVINGETVFVGIIYDLTEKKRGEELILHHQKLDAIGQLSGGVAHDFNNILNVITGNLEMIADQPLPPAAKRAVARAQDAAWRAARTTQRLLAFARRQPLRPQVLSLNDTLASLSDMLTRTLGETIEVSMDLAPDAAQVEADIDQFETAILNLAVNARDAMPKGGRLHIETANVTFAEKPGTVLDAPPGDYVLVAVSDNGEGMTPDVLAKAIEPFFTTKDAGAGTGLGLSMVYGFLKQLGGHARIYSEPGKGTRVSLYFPRADGQEAIGAEPGAAEEQHGRGETVLLVEDDPDVRLVTQSRLERLGYRVIVAVDGPSALRVLRSDTHVDLVFSDIVMPGGMSGHDIAAVAKTARPEAAIVLTSGYSKELAGGGAPVATHFLSKPYSKQKLAEVLRAALDGPR